jgi:8-oxo-dGTP diphosphatase
MSLPLKWEFPGGKINDGESPEECLKRELAEELGIEVTIGASMPISTYYYPKFSVTLYPFICKIVSGEIVLHEHAAMSWLSPEELHGLDWAEADGPVIKEYQRTFVQEYARGEQKKGGQEFMERKLSFLLFPCRTL